MIVVHRLNGTAITVNAELIETVEASPDTVLTLVTGNRYIVRESVEDVVQRVVGYRKKVYAEKAAVNPIEGYVKK